MIHSFLFAYQGNKKTEQTITHFPEDMAGTKRRFSPPLPEHNIVHLLYPIEPKISRKTPKNYRILGARKPLNA
jgi:hypothetical protein